MDRAELLPSLNLMTLIAVVLVALIGLLLFLRKRANRHVPRDGEPIATVAKTTDQP